ncbi:MAG: alpha-amylase family glycosyl hydrolase, partial [Cyclobacteriaceae bacterium]
FFAVDKYYGTENDLKEFIQVAHQNGMAVILDMVLNHAFGQNAMVRMHWDPSINTVSEESPWFNQQAPHPFSVGFDFNHESQYTKDFVDDVNRYWIEEFHFDGYRFDLTKGFTQNQSNESSASNYDQSRIDILTRMAEEIWEVDEEAYVILEHFTSISEESVLRQAGMMTWGNNNHDYRNLLKGSISASINSAAELSRVSYMESHDEERVAWEMKNFGTTRTGYDIKSPEVYFERSMLGAAFFFPLPGPKMLWQFQELGYDIELNDNRLANKPLPWGEGNLGYYEDEDRQKIYKVYSAIIGLKNDFATSFDEGTLTTELSGTVKNITLAHEDLNMVIVGNFESSKQGTTVRFITSGTWYDYLTGDELEVVDVNWQYEMAPGEFHIFTDVKLDVPGEDLVSFELPKDETVTDADELIEGDFIVYPSSATDKLNLRLTKGESPVREIQFISLDGKNYHSKASREAGNIYQVSVQELPKGLYIVRIPADGSVYQTRFVKK